MESVTIGVVVHFLASLALIIRVLTRPHREPASRIAWIAVIAALPIVGILAYVFFGEVNIGRARAYLFACDWIENTKEDLSDLLRNPGGTSAAGFPAQVIGTGPTVRFSAMPEIFESLFHAARHELVISTPYFVPNDSTRDALCAAAYRGVETTIIFPAKNDSWIVAAASRSYYQDLLSAGVRIHEYVGGLLHAKTLTIDREVLLIGSANMDRRSFDLNYENNILLVDTELTEQLRQRQQQYIDSSTEVTQQDVASWSLGKRLWNNTLATIGPIL